MSLEKQKENLSVKLDERKVKFEEKKAEAKIKREEKKIALKEKRADKKINAHFENAIKSINKAEEDADKDIVKLLDNVEEEIEADEKPIELILFNANNKLEEIVLKAGLKIVKAKNHLFKNLEKDFENVAEIISLEEELAIVKDESDEVAALLDERIDIEKETLALNEK